MKVPARNERQITLLDLATQSSGLPRMPTNFTPKNPANPYADYTVQQLYDFLSRYQRRHLTHERVIQSMACQNIAQYGCDARHTANGAPVVSCRPSTAPYSHARRRI